MKIQVRKVFAPESTTFQVSGFKPSWFKQFRSDFCFYAYTDHAADLKHVVVPPIKLSDEVFHVKPRYCIIIILHASESMIMGILLEAWKKTNAICLQGREGDKEIVTERWWYTPDEMVKRVGGASVIHLLYQKFRSCWWELPLSICLRSNYYLKYSLILKLQ